ncbi:MAG: hypothetical protein LIO91_08780 [Bacteroidales bacterium]|nr:hypothetical protein [Bacteroidales bacterium]
MNLTFGLSRKKADARERVNAAQREMVAMDLTLVSAWGLCALWVAGNWWIVALAVVALLARVLMSLGLYARERKIGWIVGGWTFAVALTVAVGGVGELRALLLPMTKCVDCVWRFLYHDNSLFRGVYQAAIHPGEPSIKAGSEDLTLWVWSLSAWFYLLPVLWYCVLAFRRLLGKAPTDVITVAMEYAVTALALCVAVAVGRTTPAIGSLVAILACSWALIYVLYQWFDHLEPRQGAWFYLIIAIGDTCFWASQWETGDMRLRLAYACPALAFFCALAYWLMRKRTLKAAAFAIVLGWLIPFLSLGYNVLTCKDATRVCRFDGYPWAPNGILRIEEDGLDGVRDRYGEIISCHYDSLQYLGQGTPYWAALRDREYLWHIIDMETHELLDDPDYNSVTECRSIPRSWILAFDSNSEMGEIFGLFQVQPYYSRFRRDDNWRYIPYRTASQLVH